MRRRQAVYGLDIETDTTENGLDPRVAAVVTVALAGPGYEEVFTGPEAELLVDLDERLAELEPGVSPPGTAPPSTCRSCPTEPRCTACRSGCACSTTASITMRRAPLPGHRGAYRASWYDHGHLDAYRLYRGDVGPALRISCSLKSIARFVGLVPVEVDRTRIHDLSNEALHAYAASDARLARILTERRWGTASRFIDRVAPGRPDRPPCPRPRARTPSPRSPLSAVTPRLPCWRSRDPRIASPTTPSPRGAPMRSARPSSCRRRRRGPDPRVPPRRGRHHRPDHRSTSPATSSCTSTVRSTPRSASGSRASTATCTPSRCSPASPPPTTGRRSGSAPRGNAHHLDHPDAPPERTAVTFLVDRDGNEASVLRFGRGDQRTRRPRGGHDPRCRPTRARRRHQRCHPRPRLPSGPRCGSTGCSSAGANPSAAAI